MFLAPFSFYFLPLNFAFKLNVITKNKQNLNLFHFAQRMVGEVLLSTFLSGNSIGMFEEVILYGRDL